MVLVIGPSRVGKTTLIRLLEQELIARTGEHLRSSPAHRPFVSISATGPGSGRFDWVDYYTAILRQVNNPFLKRKPSAIRVLDMREAMEEALIGHAPIGANLRDQTRKKGGGKGDNRPFHGTVY